MFLYIFLFFHRCDFFSPVFHCCCNMAISLSWGSKRFYFVLRYFVNFFTCGDDDILAIVFLTTPCYSLFCRKISPASQQPPSVTCRMAAVIRELQPGSYALPEPREVGPLPHLQPGEYCPHIDILQLLCQHPTLVLLKDLIPLFKQKLCLIHVILYFVSSPCVAVFEYSLVSVVRY